MLIPFNNITQLALEAAIVALATFAGVVADYYRASQLLARRARRQQLPDSAKEALRAARERVRGQ